MLVMDANTIKVVRNAVRNCQRTIGFMSLTASVFRSRAEQFLNGTLPQDQYTTFASDLMRWS